MGDDELTFVTVLRDRVTKELRYYQGHNDDVDILPYVTGDVLQVYTGHYKGIDKFHRQVVLANKRPGFPGPNNETGYLVFEGPRLEALEIFEGHVGMLP